MFFRKYLIKAKVNKVKKEALAVKRLATLAEINFMMQEAHRLWLANDRLGKNALALYHRGSFEALQKCFKDGTRR